MVQHHEGMLFDSTSPTAKADLLRVILSALSPGGSDTYCGAVMEQDDGRKSGIERDFLEKQDGVKIYDNVTGRTSPPLGPLR